MSHIFGHDKATHGCRRAEHDEDCDEAVIAEPQMNGDRQKERAKQHKLKKRSGDCRLQHGNCLFEMKACPHCHQAERRGKICDIADSLRKNHGLRNAACRPDEPYKNAENDRIRRNAAAGLPDELCASVFRFRSSIRARKFQKEYRHNIVERNGADDHHGRHAGIAVNILNKADAQKCGTGTIGGLREFAAGFFVF